MSAPMSPDRARRSMTTLAALLLLVGGSAILFVSGGAAGQGELPVQAAECVQDAVDDAELPEDLENLRVPSEVFPPTPPTPPIPEGGDDPVFLYEQYLTTYLTTVIGLFGQDNVEDTADCARDQVPRVDQQEGNLTVEDLQVAQNLTWGEPNNVSATVTNRGNTPLFFEAKLFVRNEDRGWVQPESADSLEAEHEPRYTIGDPIQRGVSRTVTFVWDGTVPHPDSGQQNDPVPIRGDVDIRVQAESPGGGGEPVPGTSVHLNGTIAQDHAETSREMIIRDIDFVAPPDPETETMPAGGSWQVGLTLESDSNRPVTVDLSVLDTLDAAEGWTASFDENPITIPAGEGQSRPIIATITAPEDAIKNERGRVEIQAQSQRAPTSEHAQDTVVVKTPAVEQEGSILVSFSPEQDSLPAAPTSASVPLDVQAQNVLNANVTVTDIIMKATSWPETANGDDWYHGDAWNVPDESTLLEPGNQTEWTVSLPVPKTALNGSYGWEIELAAEDDEGINVCSASDPCNTEGNFMLEVPQWFEVDLAAGEGFPEQLAPGQPVPLPLKLTNAGNGPDDIDLELVDAPEGWSLGGDTRVHLPAGRTNTTCSDPIGCMTLETPSSTDPGLASFEVRASSANASGEATTIHASIDVLPRAYPDIEVATPCQEASDRDCLVPIEPGVGKEIHLTLHNRGNVEDKFTLENETTVEPPADDGDDDAWSLTRDTGNVTVGPNESASLTLVVHSPSQLAIEDGLEIELNLTASNDHQHDDEELWWSQRTLFVQSGFPDLVVAEPRVDPDPLYRDLEGQLTLPVENRGTSGSPSTTLHVAFEDRSGDSVEDVGFVEADIDALDWTGEDTVENVTIPLPTGHSSLHVVAEVDPPGTIDERDADGGNNQLDTQLTLRRFDIRLSAPANFEVEPGQTVSLEADRAFTIENAGEVSENLTAELSAEPAWARDAWNGTLAPGDSRALTANFQVPDRPGVREAMVTASLQHEEHEALNRSASLTLVVNDTHPPQIQNVSAPSETEVGASTTFTAEILDATGVATASIALLDPSGTVQDLPMEPVSDEEDLYRLDHVFQQPGTYEWYVHAVDDSADEHSADTADEPRTIEITPADGPQLSLVSPAPGTPIQPGTWVTVGVSTEGDVALASAVYERDGQTHELDPGNPLEIDTAEWPDGEHEVLVRAEDASGGVHEQSFTIAVDGTQPSVTLEVQPAQPEPGDTVQVSAQVDEPIASTHVRVDYADGSGEEHEMGLFDETYRTSFQTPTDKALTGLTVIAEDEAGNTATTEHTIAGGEALEQMDADGSEEDSRLLPLGTPVVLASLLTAGLVAAWRRGRGS